MCADCVLKLEKRSLVATKKEYKAGQILTESKVIILGKQLKLNIDRTVLLVLSDPTFN